MAVPVTCAVNYDHSWTKSAFYFKINALIRNGGGDFIRIFAKTRTNDIEGPLEQSIFPKFDWDHGRYSYGAQRYDDDVWRYIEAPGDASLSENDENWEPNAPKKKKKKKKKKMQKGSAKYKK